MPAIGRLFAANIVLAMVYAVTWTQLSFLFIGRASRLRSLSAVFGPDGPSDYDSVIIGELP